MNLSIIKRLFKTIYWFPYFAYCFLRQKFFNDVIFCQCWSRFILFKRKNLNWGDDLNKYFFEFVTGKKLVFIPYDKTFLPRNIHYSLIGSTISHYNLKNTIIYGSGLMNDFDEIKSLPLEIISVRGPLTRSALKQKNIDCPEIFGDPALLLPIFYKPKKTNTIKFLFIPHKGTKNFSAINKFINDYGGKIINISRYKKWTDIIDEIYNSEFVISESLHGIITAETYGIPNIWAEFIEHDNSWDFKYNDFYESIGKFNMKSFRFYENYKFNDLIAVKNSWSKGNINYKNLLKTFPFTIKNAKSISKRNNSYS